MDLGVSIPNLRGLAGARAALISSFPVRLVNLAQFFNGR